MSEGTLVVGLKYGEKLFVGDVEIIVTKDTHTRARVMVKAPKNVPILRESYRKRADALVDGQKDREG